MRTQTLAAALAALALALGAPGCKKDQASNNEPPKADERRAAAAQLAAPPLFAHIPSDTPYVFAAFEALPDSYWKLVGDSIRPELETLLTVLAAAPDSDPGMLFVKGVVRELQGNLNEATLTRLFGISSKSRWAIYGVGLVPVFRLELADPKALTATVERLSKEANLPLPTQTLGGRSYWRFDDGDVLVVAAVADGQLVVAGGPTAMVDKALPFVLGTEVPKPNMADGGAVKEVAARHGFSGYGAGYVDAAKLLNVIMVADFFQRVAGGGVPDACRPKLTELAARFPRLAFGYDEVSDRSMAMRIVLEMDKATVARLSELQVEVPGMSGGATADPVLFAFGAAVDLPRAQKLLADAADGLAAFGAACGGDLARDAAEMKEAVSQPLPAPFGKLRGGLVALIDASVAGGQPSGVEGYALLASDDPGAVVDFVTSQLPPGQVPAIARDGKFHQVVPAGAVPGVGAIQAAVKDKALVLATGARGTESAERALAKGGQAPLVFISYDYGRFMKLAADAMGPLGLAGASDIAAMFGVAAMWAYVSDHGLALGFRMEMKK